MSYCGKPQFWPPSQPAGTPRAPSFWLFQSSMTTSAPHAATVNTSKNAGTTSRVIVRSSFAAMIPSPRAGLARFDPRGQVALGRARVQDAEPGLDRVRWRQGGHQRRGGEAGQACPCRRSHQGDAAARAPSRPEGCRRRRPARIRGGGAGALRGLDAARAPAFPPGAAARARARYRPTHQARTPRSRSPARMVVRAEGRRVREASPSVGRRSCEPRGVASARRALQWAGDRASRGASRPRGEPFSGPAIVRAEGRRVREAIPKIRRPKAKHTTDQIVAQARQLGWTVGVTMADLIGAQCGAVIGLHPQDAEWLSGRRMAGVWFKSAEDASLHQHAMDCVPHGRYRAMAVAPLTSGRLDPPDICLIYGTPGQMIFFINGLQWTGYRKLSFTSVGEAACADSWGKALKTGEPALTIPCYAQRRYGGGADDELLMAIPPRLFPQAIEGVAALHQKGP